MVMPPAAAVCGIMSWEEEEEEGAWLAIVEGGSGRRRRWERRTTEVDGELVVNHVIRRKEALIRLFNLHVLPSHLHRPRLVNCQTKDCRRSRMRHSFRCVYIY